MLLNLWNNFRGYVTIEVSGFSVERFVNLATHKGVYIWDIRYIGSSVHMKVSAKGFKMLRNCARKTKCKIKIKEKSGLPFVLFRYRKRKILAFGVFFFIFSMYFLSSFVWLIEVDGNERLSSEDLLNFLNPQGLKIGVAKYKVDEKLLADMCLKRFSDISWINIHVKGTKATVYISEILPTQEIVDRNTPCNIVAKKDGLVTSIVTSAGTPLIKQKDVVKKGELLVSGELTVKDDETGTVMDYVHARAEIWAKMYNEINFNVPLLYNEKKYTGNIKKGYSINIFDRTINLINGGNMFANYDKITFRHQLKFGENYPLPIIVITEEYREFEHFEKQRSVEQAKDLAERMVNGRIIREFDFETDVIDKEIEFAEQSDGLDVKAVITNLERIDLAVPINPLTDSQTVEN